MSPDLGFPTISITIRCNLNHSVEPDVKRSAVEPVAYRILNREIWLKITLINPAGLVCARQADSSALTILAVSSDPDCDEPIRAPKCGIQTNRGCANLAPLRDPFSYF